MSKLPVYKVAPPSRPSLNTVDIMAGRFFDADDYSLNNINGRRVVKSESKLIDLNDQEGAVFAADRVRLWNVEEKPRLPETHEAHKIGYEFLRKNELLPDLERDDRVAVEMVGIAPSFVATLDKTTGRRQTQQLDHRVSYSARMLVTDPVKEEKVRLPIIGGTGKFNVTVGDAGRVIGFSRQWKPIDTVEMNAAFIPRKVADEQFRKLTRNIRVESFSADLAYAYAFLAAGEHLLYPVWAYRAVGIVNDHKFPLRMITLPATEFGPPLLPDDPQPVRVQRELPRAWDLNTARRSYRNINPYEAGTSWIGDIGGLGGSQMNAQGFVDGLRDAGWNINFNWGNCNAWESDWHDNDDTYVDAADFVFYTGHAGVDGWQLVNPANCNADYLVSAEVGAGPEHPGDIWGRQDLEWIAIAACGPLEDDLLSPGGGNVLHRWDGAFDGLHILMGYGAVTFDNVDEGRLLVQYAREGLPLIDAWFRTAVEIQPANNGWGAPYGPTVYVGAMYARKGGLTSPRNDHLWGYGSVAPDPVDPDGFTCLWVPC
jgi:hypothetical protein